MKIVECLLMLFLIVTAVAAPLQKNILITVIIYTGFGLVMSVLWMLLRAPDLAVTEAAVGAGVTGILFFLALRRVNQMKGADKDE